MRRVAGLEGRRRATTQPDADDDGSTILIDHTPLVRRAPVADQGGATAHDEAARLQNLERLLSTGRFNDAIAEFQLLPEAERVKPRALLVAATCLARMGNHEQSVTMGEAALRAHRTASDRRGHQHTLVVLGASAIENGRLGDAERYLSAAAEMTGAAAAEEHTLMLLTNMGILAHVRGRTRAAVASFLKSLAIATRLRIPAAVAQAHHNLGLALRELGHTQEADEHVTQAILFATIARNAALIATTLLGRAEMKIAQRRFQEARIDIKEALERASSAGDEIGVAEAYRLLAVLGVRSSDFGAAVDPAREGRRIAIRRGSRVLAAECRAIEAEALRGAGEGIQASGAHAEALTELTSLGAENAARLAQRWWRMGLPAPGVEKAIDVPA